MLLPASVAIQIAQYVGQGNLGTLINLLICSRFWLSVAQLPELWSAFPDLGPVCLQHLANDGQKAFTSLQALNNWYKGRVVPLVIGQPKEFREGGSGSKAISVDVIPGTPLLLLRRKVVIRGSCGGVSTRLPSQLYNYVKPCATLKGKTSANYRFWISILTFQEEIVGTVPATFALHFVSARDWPQTETLIAYTRRSASRFKLHLTDPESVFEESNFPSANGQPAQVVRPCLAVAGSNTSVDWISPYRQMYYDDAVGHVQSLALVDHMIYRRGQSRIELTEQYVTTYDHATGQILIYERTVSRLGLEMVPVWSFPYPGISEEIRTSDTRRWFLSSLQLVPPFLYIQDSLDRDTRLLRIDVETGALTPGWPVSLGDILAVFACSQHLAVVADIGYNTQRPLLVLQADGRRGQRPLKVDGIVRHVALLDVGRILVVTLVSTTIYTEQPLTLPAWPHKVAPCPSVLVTGKLTPYNIPLYEVDNLPQLLGEPTPTVHTIYSFVIDSPRKDQPAPERFVVLYPGQVAEQHRLDEAKRFLKSRKRALLLGRLLQRAHPGRLQIFPCSVPRFRLTSKNNFGTGQANNQFLHPQEDLRLTGPWLLVRELKTDQGWWAAPLPLDLVKQLLKTEFQAEKP